MLQRIIAVACIVGSLAFLGQAILAPFYETGVFRVFAPLALVGEAFVLLSFLRRRRWSWLWAFALGLVVPILSIFSFPTEEYFGKLVFIMRILVVCQSLACLAILLSMLFPGTKRWFTHSAITDNTNEGNFHQGEVLEVTYRNQFWDVFRLSLYVMPRNRNVQISCTLIALVTGEFVFGGGISTQYPFSILAITYCFILIAVVLAMVIFGLTLQAIIQLVRAFDIRTSLESRLSVSEGGVLCKTPFKLIKVNWTGIHSVQENSSFIILFISDWQALAIPKRSFASSSDADKFYEYSRRCYERAKNAAPR